MHSESYLYLVKVGVHLVLQLLVLFFQGGHLLQSLLILVQSRLYLSEPLSLYRSNKNTMDVSQS